MNGTKHGAWRNPYTREINAYLTLVLNKFVSAKHQFPFFGNIHLSISLSTIANIANVVPFRSVYDVSSIWYYFGKYGTGGDK